MDSKYAAWQQRLAATEAHMTADKEIIGGEKTTLRELRERLQVRHSQLDEMQVSFWLSQIFKNNQVSFFQQSVLIICERLFPPFCLCRLSTTQQLKQKMKHSEKK